MRKILFRAKRLDNGEWIESETYLKMTTTAGTIKGIYFSAKTTVEVDYDTFGNLKGLRPTVDRCMYYKVDDFTIGQFTGTDDNNGKHIFEGDIVYDEFVGEYAIVTFNSGSFWMEYPKAQCNILHEVAHSLLVKGNIYDNPELYALARGESEW